MLRSSRCSLITNHASHRFTVSQFTLFIALLHCVSNATGQEVESEQAMNTVTAFHEWKHAEKEFRAVIQYQLSDSTTFAMQSLIVTVGDYSPQVKYTTGAEKVSVVIDDAQKIVMPIGHGLILHKKGVFEVYLLDRISGSPELGDTEIQDYIESSVTEAIAFR